MGVVHAYLPGTGKTAEVTPGIPQLLDPFGA